MSMLSFFCCGFPQLGIMSLQLLELDFLHFRWLKFFGNYCLQVDAVGAIWGQFEWVFDWAPAYAWISYLPVHLLIVIELQMRNKASLPWTDDFFRLLGAHALVLANVHFEKISSFLFSIASAKHFFLERAEITSGLIFIGWIEDKLGKIPIYMVSDCQLADVVTGGVARHETWYFQVGILNRIQATIWEIKDNFSFTMACHRVQTTDPGFVLKPAWEAVIFALQEEVLNGWVMAHLLSKVLFTIGSLQLQCLAQNRIKRNSAGDDRGTSAQTAYIEAADPFQSLDWILRCGGIAQMCTTESSIVSRCL